MKHLSYRTFAALVSLALVACGGGGTTPGVDAAVPTPDSGGTPDTSTPPVDGGPNPLDSLALACDSDADCGGGHCFRDTDTNQVFGGGPAHGYCSLECDTDSDCGSSGRCLVRDGAGICLATCEPGPALENLDEALDESKCQGRDDLACVTFDEGSLCAGACRGDSDCPTGRHCSLQSGTCMDAENEGLPRGDACDPAASACAGGCIDFGDFGLCSDRCTLGGDVEMDCGGLASGLCIYSQEGAGAGDQGFCAEHCVSQDDCNTPNVFCLPIGGIPDGGYCLGTVTCTAGATCANPDLTCTETTLGFFCLAEAIPLGAIAPPPPPPPEP